MPPYPVLSLMPVPGEVDVVVGAELMEAGRAIQRGLVAPDKTTLIASSHRSFAVQEKLVPGDGIADSAKVYEAAGAAAKRFVAFDMAELADSTGSAISAVLFGALAGSSALPFAREAYEATIRAAGIGIEPSLRAFAAGFERTQADAASATPPDAAQTRFGRQALSSACADRRCRLRCARRRCPRDVSRAAARHDRRRLAQGRRLSGRRLWPRISRSRRRFSAP